MRAAILAVVVAAAASSGCLDRTCTNILIFGITVDVTGPNDEPVDAIVTLRDGSFVEVIEPGTPYQNGTLYMGAGERAGTYEVTVEAPGFRTVVFQNVRVEEDECHVEPENLVVMLEPQ
jgi:hypothetical protein